MLVADWLLSSPAYIEYRTRLDLLGEPEGSPGVERARQAMLSDPRVMALVSELAGWPGEVLNSHKSASQPFHRLNFLADLGLKATDPGMPPILGAVMEHVSPEGPFSLPMSNLAAQDGNATDAWAWALCDAPLIVYALSKLGLADHPRVVRARDFLVGLVRANGWPCAVSPVLGNFRGPGRKADPCPFANLAMLKVLSLAPELRAGPAAQAGVETQLGLWEQRQSHHPYIFYMGTDFCKLKAPLVWYDILHVLDVLSMFPGAIADPRFRDMLAVALAKAGPDGRFTAESVYAPWKDWDFGQKKAPSAWITFLIQRIRHRAGSLEGPFQ